MVSSQEVRLVLVAVLDLEIEERREFIIGLPGADVIRHQAEEDVSLRSHVIDHDHQLVIIVHSGLPEQSIAQVGGYVDLPGGVCRWIDLVKVDVGRPELPRHHEQPPVWKVEHLQRQHPPRQTDGLSSIQDQPAVQQDAIELKFHCSCVGVEETEWDRLPGLNDRFFCWRRAATTGNGEEQNHQPLPAAGSMSGLCGIWHTAVYITEGHGVPHFRQWHL